MSKALTKGAVAGLACLAAVAAATVDPATSVAAPHAHATSSKASISKYAYNAQVFGTKVVVDGVTLRNLKDATALRTCTRKTGQASQAKSILSLPDALDGLVTLSASTSNTKTYNAKGLQGVQATNTIADISVGGTLPGGIKTPRLVLKGLQSTADSFYNTKTKKFGETHSFKYGHLGLELTSNDPVTSSLKKLLGALGIDPDKAIDKVVSVPVDTLISVLQKTAITIPGLGKLALGTATGSATRTGAEADAYALKLTVNIPQLNTAPTLIQLGRATSNISSPSGFGVFRSNLSAVEATVGDILNLGGVVNLGGIADKKIPCAGTNGRVVTKRVASAGLQGILTLDGIKYQYQGLGQGQRAKGFVSTTIGDVNIPVAGVELKGLTSRVDVTSKAVNQRVHSKATTTLGQLLINGTAVKIPAVGQILKFTNSTGQQGWLERGVLSAPTNGFYGRQITGLRIQIPGLGTKVDLGVANGQVFFR